MGFGLNKIIYIRCSEQCLAHSKPSISAVINSIIDTVRRRTGLPRLTCQVPEAVTGSRHPLELRAKQDRGGHFCGAVSCAGSGRLRCLIMTLQPWCPRSPALGDPTACHQCCSGLGSRRHLGLRRPGPHIPLFLTASGPPPSPGDEKAGSGSECGQESWLLDPAPPPGQQVPGQVTVLGMEIWAGLETSVEPFVLYHGGHWGPGKASDSSKVVPKVSG